MTRMIRREDEEFAHDPAIRGYRIAYRRHETNYCPSCGRRLELLDFETVHGLLREQGKRTKRPVLALRKSEPRESVRS